MTATDFFWIFLIIIALQPLFAAEDFGIWPPAQQAVVRREGMI